jgi:hypothetical protein
MDPQMRGRQTAEVVLLWQFLFNYSLSKAVKKSMGVVKINTILPIRTHFVVKAGEPGGVEEKPNSTRSN